MPRGVKSEERKVKSGGTLRDGKDEERLAQSPQGSQRGETLKTVETRFAGIEKRPTPQRTQRKPHVETQEAQKILDRIYKMNGITRRKMRE